MKFSNTKICLLVEDIYEDMELQYPKFRLKEEGIEVVIAGPEAGKTYHGKYGYPCKADIAFPNLYSHDFDGIVIPGGFAPDRLRRDPQVLSFIKQLHEEKKLIAFICHAGWVVISAGIIKGVECTSTSAIKDDLVNAGAKWIDKSVVIDRHIVSSRRPDDLPDFCRSIFTVLENAHKQMTS